jgi:hypothetical protein
MPWPIECSPGQTSRLLEDQPALRADLKLAGLLLRHLLSLVSAGSIEIEG